MSALTTVHQLESRTASTLGARLTEQAESIPDKTLLITPERRLTYAQMATITSRVAAGFQHIGVKQRDVVCQMLPNCEAFVVNWLALAKIGAVNAPINPEFSGAALARLINLTQARALVLEADLESSIAAIEGELEYLETIIYRAGNDFKPDQRLARFDCRYLSSLEQSGAEPDPVQIQFADPVMVLFTSGTTGPSKAVEWSHRYALHYSAEYIEHWELVEEDVLYTAYPLFHVDAAVSTFLTALHRGASAVVMPKFSVSRFWSDIGEHGVTITTFMGAVSVFLFNQPRQPDDADNPLRLVLMGPVPDFWREFEQRFDLKVVAGFGTTEACFFCWPDLTRPHIDDTYGRPCEHYEVRIGNDFDELQPAGVSGEVLLRPRSPYTIMIGYYKKPVATTDAWRNLWYHTGDLGYLDADGYLHFIGRKKDAIRRRGENISAYEVEEVLNQHPDIIDCAVIGVPSEYTEEEVKAIVVLRNARAVNAIGIVEWARGRLPRYALPRFVEFTDELPTTETGKLQKTFLKNGWRNPSTFDLETGAYLES